MFKVYVSPLGVIVNDSGNSTRVLPGYGVLTEVATRPPQLRLYYVVYPSTEAPPTKQQITQAWPTVAVASGSSPSPSTPTTYQFTEASGLVSGVSYKLAVVA